MVYQVLHDVGQFGRIATREVSFQKFGDRLTFGGNLSVKFPRKENILQYRVLGMTRLYLIKKLSQKNVGLTLRVKDHCRAKFGKNNDHPIIAENVASSTVWVNIQVMEHTKKRLNSSKK